MDRSNTSSFFNEAIKGSPLLLMESINVTSNIYTLGASPWNYFNIDSRYNDQSEYYSRNKSVFATRTIGKQTYERGIKIGFSPFSFLNIAGSYDKNDIEQFESPTVDLSPNFLRNNYDQKLDLQLRSSSVNTTFTPFSFISLIVGGENKEITQISRGSKVLNQAFLQQTVTTGARYRPWQDWEMGVDFGYKRLRDGTTPFVRGYQQKTTLTYKPINYQNFNVLLDFSSERNYGAGFNDIERSALLQTTGEFLDFQIRNRDDVVMLGSLIVNVIIPMDNVRYIEKIEISGEGYVKKISDKINPDNAYDITGMLIKTTVRL